MEVISGWPMYFISTQLDVVVESWPWACSSVYLWYSGFSLNSFDVGFEPWDSSLWCTLPITGACMRCDGTINYAATNSSMCCDIWDYVLFNFGVSPLRGILLLNRIDWVPKWLNWFSIYVRNPRTSNHVTRTLVVDLLWTVYVEAGHLLELQNPDFAKYQSNWFLLYSRFPDPDDFFSCDSSSRPRKIHYRCLNHSSNTMAFNKA